MRTNSRRQYLPNQAARRGRAEAIRQYRAEGWTHQEIAQTLGVDRSLVTYYLSPRCKSGIPRGARAVPLPVPIVVLYDDGRIEAEVTG